MLSIGSTLRCARLTLSKWSATPRIPVLLVLIVAFLAYHTHSLVRFAAAEGQPLAPWIFPHLLTPAVLMVSGSFTLLLFADAPFMDRHTPFVVVRCGRLAWLNGQILYVLAGSLLFTLVLTLGSILVLLPNLALANDWGLILKTLAADASAGRRHDLVLTVFVSDVVVRQFSPLQAMLISMGLFWLATVFTGLLIFTVNLVTRSSGGLFAAGGLIAMTYFAGIQGRFVFGDAIRFFTPLSWASMHNISWRDAGNQAGFAQISPAFVVSSLLGASLLLGILANIVFLRQDLEIKGGQLHE
ncbi:MAG: hypothetical protein GX112_05930 [Clostridiaceae bacterium]|nr:hypothetical protein [Clostridiaceae bacterium]